MKIYYLLLLLFSFFIHTTVNAASFTILQLNDIYEIAPLNAGKTGGLARVATLKKQLTEENPNTFGVLAGDVLSPSAIGTAVIDGTPVAGKQMIALFNQLGWEYATFGNHEFDIGKSALQERINESKTKFFSSNVLDHDTKQLFPKTEKTIILTIEGIKVGLVGITIPELKRDFIDILDPFVSAKAAVQELKQQGVTFIVLVTHQDFQDDIKFAEKLPDVDLIIGGHNHENMLLYRGQKFIPIAKADANARSAYVHRFNFDEETGKKSISSKIMFLNESIPLDAETTELVNKWQEQAFSLYRQQGLEPNHVIAHLSESLDGLDSSVRYKTTALTEMIAAAFLHAYPEADLSLYNSGSIRIDDIIQPGDITEYDIIKILAFGGYLNLVEMDGESLQKTLNVANTLQGKGSFLHYANIKQDNGKWFVSGKPIVLKQKYKVVLPDFLVEKGDIGLDFLKFNTNPKIKLVSDKKVEVRKALIQEFSNPKAASNNN